MIAAVDRMLRRVLLAGVPNLPQENLSFQPPNEAWQQRVGAANGISVNVYLTELAEEAKLRTNERQRRIEEGVVHERPAPTRIRLDYAVSVWNAKANSVQVQATEDEHVVLADVLRALLRAAPLNAGRLLSPAQLALVPEAMREEDLPTSVAPSRGYPGLPELWGTMGRGVPWRPVVGVSVVVPVTYPEVEAGGIVREIVTDVHFMDSEEGDVRAVVGGHVLRPTADPARPAPVEGALVLARDGALRVASARTGDDGAFVLDGLVPGTYTLHVAAAGFAAPPPAPLTVPRVHEDPLELLLT